MSGTLFVVATPIGNLEDVTLRALRVLRGVDLIAAEDTRRTARLLAHHGISTRSVSFHEHNTRTRIPQLLERLRHGSSIALVSDAGTPGVSDPGVELVQACIAADIPVDPIPGVSAPLTAAIASGFPLIPLTVLGFAPTLSKDRSAWFKTLSEVHNTVTFFESPHRIRKTLADAGFVLGNRPIVVARELTKLHQSILRGTGEQLSKNLAEPKGEFTVVVGPQTAVGTRRKTPDDSEIFAEFCHSTDVTGLSRRAAISVVAKRHGISSRLAYEIVERAKSVSNDQI